MITKLNTLQDDKVLNAETINEIIGGINSLIDEIALLKTQNSFLKLIVGQNPVENANAFLQIGNGNSSTPNTLFEVSTNNIKLNNTVTLQGLETKELENKDLMSYLNFLENKIIELEHSVNGWVETIKEEGKEDKEVEHEGLIERMVVLEEDLLSTYDEDGTVKKKGMILATQELLDDWKLVKNSLINYPEEEGQLKSNKLKLSYLNQIDDWKTKLNDIEKTEGDKTTTIEGTISLANDYKNHKEQMTSVNNFYDSIANITDLKNKLEAYKTTVKDIDFNSYLKTIDLESKLKEILFPTTTPVGNSAAEQLNKKINSLITTDNSTALPDKLKTRLEDLEKAITKLCGLEESEDK